MKPRTEDPAITDASRDSNFAGDYARDPHREGLGDDYAREKPIAGDDAKLRIDNEQTE